MADLISFPPRLGPNGHMVTRPEDSVDYYEELLAVLVLTKPGERSQVPLFGVNDPTFFEIDEYDLTAKVSIFGPPIRITGLITRFVTPTEQQVVLEFEVADSGTVTTTLGV